MGQHTPEPWKMDSTRTKVAADHDGWTFQCVADHVGFENGDRIVACVNALAGIADPAKFVEAARELCEASDGLDTYAGEFSRIGEAISSFRAADRSPQ